MAIFTVFFTAALVMADQLLKSWAVANLSGGVSIDGIPGVLDFFLVYNDGAAFNMLGGKQTLLIVMTGVALVALLVYLLLGKADGKLEYAALILILSGGIGNLIDRVMNQVVVDYIRLIFMDFPVFNFADICVCTGVGLFALSMILSELKGRKNPDHGKA